MNKKEFSIECLVYIWTNKENQSVLSFIPYLPGVKSDIVKGKSIQHRAEETNLQLSGEVLNEFYNNLDDSSNLTTGTIVNVERKHLILISELEKKYNHAS